MSFDAHANLAISTVATAPTPATSGASVVVASGQGARFPAPPFNATIWPTGSSPTPSNAEIVRVTAIATDTLTITRAQEGTTARSVGVGDQIAAAITAKTVTDIERGVGVLAYAAYNPNSMVTYTRANATMADVDATNLAVAFTAPPSGNVLVRLSALGQVAGSGAHFWGLRESTTDLAGRAQATNSQTGLRFTSVPIVVTGLTPGSSHTYKWAFGSSGGTITASLFAGGETDTNHAGAAVMEVLALP